MHIRNFYTEKKRNARSIARRYPERSESRILESHAREFNRLHYALIRSAHGPVPGELQPFGQNLPFLPFTDAQFALLRWQVEFRGIQVIWK